GYTAAQLSEMADAYHKVGAAYLDEWNSGAGKAGDLKTNPAVGASIVNAFLDVVKKVLAFWDSADLQKWGGKKPEIPGLPQQQAVSKEVGDAINVAAGDVKAVQSSIGNDMSQVGAAVSNCKS